MQRQASESVRESERKGTVRRRLAGSPGVGPSTQFRAARLPLPEDQMRCFRYAARTGVLPLASLFRDWTTELTECRRGLERVLRALPATILVSFGSTVYGAAVLPGSYGYFLTNAVMSVFLGLVLIEQTRARLRNVGSLEEQLQLQNHYLRTSIAKL
jgi:hypothetical protein